MSRLSIPFVFLMMLFGVATANSDGQPQKGPLLEEITHEAVADNTEKLIFKLSVTHSPKIFKIKGQKPRLVIDFFDTGYSARIRKITNADDHLIKSVRIGMHKDPPKTRVVVDLRTEREYDYKVDSQEQDNTLTITFYFESKSTELVAEDQETVPAVESQEPQTIPVPVIESVPEDSVSPPVAQTAEQPVIPPENNVLSSDEAAADVTDTQTVDDQQDTEPAEEMEINIKSQQAEERVNQIIANIKDPEPIPADPILLDVTFESTANDSEMVLFKLNDFYPPIVFGIEKGNPRVVCDFLDTGLASDIQTVIQTNGIFVSKIRTARHPNPEKVRVVLDLVPDKNYDLQQVFFKEDNLFVIIISEFEKESVNALKTVPGSVENQ
jgi:hypothetical protein